MGLAWRFKPRWRLFGQWYDGRVTLGQFARYSEASFNVGLRIDL